jgi:HD-like signal output (HDOD) protein
MSISLQELVDDVGELISFPEVCIRVNEMVNDPNCSSSDIGQVISQDPALTARMLRIANSPYYGYSTEIDTVSRAVTILGIKAIRDLVIATSTSKVFNGLPNDLISMDNFWRHSIYCGLAAKILSEQYKKGKGEAVFISGLLHDMGQLAIFNKVPELAREALLLAMEGNEESDLYLYERQIMGFDHMQVGGALAKKWKLPESLQECVEFHHEPTKAVNYPLEVAIIHIANAIAVMSELESTLEDEVPPIDEIAWEITGLNKDLLEPVMLSAREQFAVTQSLLTSGN